MNGSFFSAEHCIKINPDLNEFLELVEEKEKVEA
jgi:hypothetical protein